MRIKNIRIFIDSAVFKLPEGVKNGSIFKNFIQFFNDGEI